MGYDLHITQKNYWDGFEDDHGADGTTALRWRPAMRALLFALALSVIARPVLAETVAANEAPKRIGANLTVEGVVSEVHHTASGKMIFLDIGGRFPNNPVAAVIFSDDAVKFRDVDSLNGKTVDVSGTIKLYQGKPEIILNDPGQIKAK
jgi:DNA/RNA endonuclease YhcR with UshA esterase domain